MSSRATTSDLGTRVERALTARFGELEIAYDARLLAPREWTLAQSDWTAELLPSVPAGPVLELCSGAGHIGLHAVLHCTRSLVCVDVNPVACDYVRVNADAAGLGERVEVRRGRIDEVLADGELFPLVVADPPWVASEAVARFPEDPRHAIDGGDDGLALVRDCLAAAGAHLLPGGVLLLQVGPGQEEAVDRQAGEHGLALAEVRRAGARGALLRLDSTRGLP